eukprot:176417_1
MKKKPVAFTMLFSLSQCHWVSRPTSHLSHSEFRIYTMYYTLSGHHKQNNPSVYTVLEVSIHYSRSKLTFFFCVISSSAHRSGGCSCLSRVLFGAKKGQNTSDTAARQPSESRKIAAIRLFRILDISFAIV